LERQARAALRRERIPLERQTLLRSIDMRYEGQEHTLTLPLESAFVGGPDLERLRAMFDERHDVVYGYSIADPAEVPASGIRAVGSLEKPKLRRIAVGGPSARAARKGTREALHRESGGRVTWTIYDRDRLQAGNRLRGPAIVEEAAATTLVAPSQVLTVDELGNLVISSKRG